MTAYEFGTMLPLFLFLLLLIGGLAWYRRWRARQPPSPLGSGELYGIGGWLSLFIFSSYVLVPLFLIGKTARVFMDAEQANPILATVPGYSSYKIFSWVLVLSVVGLQIWVANRLRTRFEPSSVMYAKLLMGLCPFAVYGLDVGAAWVTLRVNAAGAEMGETVRSFVSGALWFAYFQLSTRVRNTYLRSIPKGARSAPPQSMARQEPQFEESIAPRGNDVAPPLPPTPDPR